MPPKSATPVHSAQDYKPGDLVLSKMPSYPLWPAVVVPLPYAPPKVKRSKMNKPGTVLVKFFGDSTFYFNSPSQISRLTAEQIQGFDENAAPQKELILAYKEAREFTNFENFLRERDLLEPDKEYVEYSEIRPEEDKRGSKRRSKTNNEEGSLANTLISKGKKQNGKRESKESTPSLGAKHNVKREDSTASRESETNEAKESKCIQFRARLQRGLLQRKDTPSEEELVNASNTLRELEHFAPNINTELLRVSKLQKVLKAILKIEDLKRPNDHKFHERSSILLLEWEPFIHELKEEKIRQDQINSSALDIQHDTKRENEEDEETQQAKKLKQIKLDSNSLPGDQADISTEGSNGKLTEKTHEEKEDAERDSNIGNSDGTVANILEEKSEEIKEEVQDGKDKGKESKENGEDGYQSNGADGIPGDKE